MEKLLTIENSAIMICGIVAFAVGAMICFRPQKPLYSAIAVMGLGCTMLGRLFQCILLLTGGSLTDNFQIGVLGIAGTFGFFIAAELITPDPFGSDKKKRKKASRRYDAAAYFAPIVFVGLYIMIALSPAVLAVKIAYGFTAFIIAAACFSHLRRLLIPKDESGEVRCLRVYNALALALGVACVLEMAALAWRYEVLYIIAGAAICVLLLLMVPAICRRAKK